MILLSPAKSLNLDVTSVHKNSSEPVLIDQHEILVTVMKKKSAADLSKLMSLSPNLSQLNYDRYQSMGSEHSIRDRKQAIYAFDGDVYIGLEASSLKSTATKRLQDNVRILSGLYGILKPFDLIEPYRLEMGTALKFAKHNNLYSYWQSAVTKALVNDIEASKSKYLYQLASEEYYKVVDKKQIQQPIIQFQFLEMDGKISKNISFYSKRARGLMARFILENNIQNTKDLQAFDLERYQLDASRSTATKLCFTRDFIPIGKQK